ncbi:hypothetical protein Hanom_Chr08g00730611 [Helianthus anomalus]
MMTEAVTNNNQKLSRFMKSGIYRFQGSDAVVFVDPVRLLNLSYSHFRVTPSSYYSRFFQPDPRVSQNQTKRKRKRKQKELNQREQAADERHQRVKPLLMNAHECLLRADDLLPSLGKLRMGTFEPKLTVAGDEPSFVELGSVWQAPLFEISLHLNPDYRLTADCTSLQNYEKKNVPAFGSLVSNETDSDMEADFINRRYILPKHSSFYMSSYV